MATRKQKIQTVKVGNNTPNDTEFGVYTDSTAQGKQYRNSKEAYQDRMLTRQALDSREKAIKTLYDRLTKYDPVTMLYYRINAEIGNIEYIVSANLAAGLPLSGSLVNRATQFIQSQTDLFGFEEKWIDTALYIKHTLNSQIGTHCIFGFHYKRDEQLDKSIVVHFDQEERLVMVTSIYQPFTQRTGDGIEWNEEQIALEVNNIRIGKYYIENGAVLNHKRAKNIPSRIRVERKWYTSYADIQDKPCLQVKYNAADLDYVFILDNKGKILGAHNVQAPSSLRIGKVYENFWEIEEEADRLKQVVMRNLESDSELSGRYVKVQDNIYFTIPQEWGDAIPQFTSKITMPDRFMAYYHTDLAQRYFRDLGLEILDTYPHLNPLVVELGNTDRTKYLPNEERIRFRKLNQSDGTRCTDARSAHIIYHEFTHVVTDALARLRRQNAASTKDWRYKQILQAHAMDEGFADYFACSLAKRYGATHTKVGPLKFEDARIRLDSARDLNVDDNLNGLAITAVEPKVNDNNVIDESIIYDWGQRWGRFLWKFRSYVGQEIADTVIAHSLFFLTRWSTFGMGVIGLLVADRLLFSGVHETIILEQCGGMLVKDWKFMSNENGAEDSNPDATNTGLAVKTSY